MNVRARLWDYQPDWLRIGEWLVKPAENTITNDQERVTLEPKVMDLLLFLAMRNGAVQSNDVLLKEIWGGTFYSDNPLHRSIAVLRRALGDSAASPRYIQTLRKRGYQCIANIGFPDQAPKPSDAQQLRFLSSCPFPGLNAFTAQDAPVFFGRAQAVAACADALGAQWQLGRGLALVLGPSGCGKSSLVQAGVAPLLASTSTPLPTRVVASVTWDFGVNPDQAPTDALIQAMCAWQLDQRAVYLATELSALFAAIASGDEVRELTIALADGLRRAGLLVDGVNQSGCLLLVIDHLERLIPVAQDRRAEIVRVDQILAALASTAGVLVLLIARSDFYQSLLSCLPLSMAIKAGVGHFDMPAPSAAEIALMIRGPARLAGLSFERHHNGERLDDVLRDSALAQPESLPLLQFTLEALYEAKSDNGLLSFASYEKIGRLEGALVRRAEDALSMLANASACLPAIFQRMIVLDASHHAVSARWVPWADLANDQERDLVQLLVQRRLLVSHQVDLATSNASGDEASLLREHQLTNQACFRPAHDALLRLWPRAVEWCAENQRLLEVHARVRLASTHWRANGRRRDELLNAGRPLQDALELMQWAPQAMQPDEHQFVRASMRAMRTKDFIRRAAVLSLGLLAVLAIVAGLYAQRARGISEQRRVEAEGLVDFLLNDVADKLRPIGRLDLLDAVGQQVLIQFEKSPIAKPDAANVLRRAKAMRVIAESMLGQGELKSAGDALAKAQSLVETIGSTVQSNTALIFEHATIQYWRGNLAYQSGELAVAQVHWKNYLQLTQQLLGLEPNNTVWQLEVSYALNNLGTIASDQQAFVLASEYFSQSKQIKARLQAATPTDASLTADLADTQVWLATVLESSGQLTQALAQLQTQIELLQSLVKAHPGDSEWLNRLAAAHSHLGRIALNLGDVAVAEQSNTQAISILSTLKSKDPSNELWRYSLAYGYLQQAKLLTTQELNASVFFSRAQSEIDAQTERNKTIPRWQQLAAMLLMNRSDSTGDQPSLEGLVRAEKTLVEMLVAQPNERHNRVAVAQAQTKLAQHWSGLNQKAAQHYWRAVLTTLQASDITDAQTNDFPALELIVHAAAALGKTSLSQQCMTQLHAAKFRRPDYLRWQTSQGEARAIDISQQSQ